MNRLFKCFFVVSLIVVSNQLAAQENVFEEKINQRIESISEKSEIDDTYFTSFSEHFNFLHKHPININQVSREELLSYQILNELQVANLLNHIQQNGKLISIYELQAIDGFDSFTINEILPFIKLESEPTYQDLLLKNGFNGGTNSLLIRTQKELTKQPPVNYLGSNERVYLRYRLKLNNLLNFGFQGEKDPGEAFFKGYQKQGFDFYSANLLLKKYKKIQTLVLGDYQLSFGQGLTAWSGLTFDKTSDVINVKKNGQGITPHTSADENRFMRGIASTVKVKKLEFTGFASRKKVDANIINKDSITGKVKSFSSLIVSGYHNTAALAQSKDAVTELILGGNISYRSRNLELGITSMNSVFMADYKRTPNYYNQFEFSSNKLSNIGFNYSYHAKNSVLFGEFAVGDNKSIGYVNGLLASLDKNLTVAIVNRNYQKNYQSLYSNAFAENAQPINEKGTYLSTNIKLSNQFTLNTYFDYFSFPWLKYQVKSSSYGNDFLSQLNFLGKKKEEIYFRVRIHCKMLDETIPENIIDNPIKIKQYNYRLNVAYHALPSLQLRNRVEVVLLNNKQRGYLLLQDVVFRKNQSPISLSFRYAVFQTDNYGSRIYAYENDFNGVYSVPTFFDKGNRTYLTVSYFLNRKLEMSLRYAQSVYINAQKAPQRELKAQVLIRFS